MHHSYTKEYLASQTLIIFFIAFMFVSGQCRISLAGLTTIRPSLGTRLTYDDNIIFTKRKPVDDWIYEILPGLDIKYQDARNTVDLKTNGQGQHYNTENDLDTFDVDVNLSARRQQTERLAFSFTGRFADDTTLDQTLTETGQLVRRQDRLVYAVSPEVEWKLTERSTISASLPWYKVDYDWGKYHHGSVDYDTLYFYINYSYLFSDQKTRLFIRPDIGKMNFDTGDYRSADLMFGLERNFTERLYAKALGGVNYTDAKTDIVVVDEIIWTGTDYLFHTRTETQNDHYWGWVAEAQLKWLFDRGDIDADFKRRVTPSSYGEPVVSSYLTTVFNWRLTERLRSRIRGAISHIKSQNLTYDQDYYTYSVFPTLTYRLTRYIDVGIQYSYQYIDDNEHDNNNRDRNRVMFRIDIKDFNLHLNF